MMAREGAPPDDEVSAQIAANDREVLDPLALLLPAARPSPFGSGERRDLVGGRRARGRLTPGAWPPPRAAAWNSHL